MTFWVRVAVALVVGLVLASFGVSFIRGLGRPRAGAYEGEPEEVEALDVYFVCGECGTEYKVTRLGELHVPRHCGEPMQVVRRPPVSPDLN